MIERARNLIRLELQILPHKMYHIRNKTKQSIDYSELSNYGNYGDCDDCVDYAVITELLSDETARNIIMQNYPRVLRWGDYYPMKTAKDMIKKREFCYSKESRLIEILELVKEKKGIAKARQYLRDEMMNLCEFNRSLRELDEIGINPVTIPRDWKIDCIPNLLRHYDFMTGNGIVG